MATPNRLSATYKQRRARPLVDALIAFRLRRGTEAHYYELVGALFIAVEIATVVARHRHLKPELNQALDALNTVYDRQDQRTVKDAYWAATPNEIDALELGVDIHTALLETTPGKQVVRALRRVRHGIERQMKERT